MPGPSQDLLSRVAGVAPGPITDALAWLVVGLFLAGVAVEWADRRGTRSPRTETHLLARGLTAGAWTLFALFWALLTPHFAFVHKSYVEGLLCVLAVPACLYTGWLLWAGRGSLFVLSRAVAVMGLVYLPFETVPQFSLGGVDVPAPREVLIETVAVQSYWFVERLGYHPAFVVGESGYRDTFRFVAADGHGLTVTVLLACTGLGSMAIFAGLIAAVRAPLGRKLRALAVAIPVIWALNLARVVFITWAFGTQSMQWFVDEVLFLFGSTDPYMVSFLLSDRVLAQVLAVVALVGLTYLVVRQLPELLTVIEDVLYLLTKEEYDLQDSLDLPRAPTDPSARADGGRRRR